MVTPEDEPEQEPDPSAIDPDPDDPAEIPGYDTDVIRNIPPDEHTDLR